MTRRGFIKWSTALVAAGAAAVGLGAGFGSDLVLRPTTEVTKTVTTTATSTTTATVTAPPPTLSYKPPLSPAVQALADTTISQLVAVHAGETVYTTSHSIGMRTPTGLFKIRLKNGVITSVEPADDFINPNVIREDSVISNDDILKGRVQPRAATQNYVSCKFLNTPDRILYPMKRIGARGDPNGQFVRMSWDEAIGTIATQLTNAKQKYGPYSIYGRNLPIAPYLGAGVGGWGNVSYGAEDFAAQFIFGLANGNSYEKAPSLLSSKLIVLWSQDPTHTMREATYYFRLARERGIPVISIDVKYTVKDDVLADQWIPIRPGTDAAMMVAVANVLLKEGLYNKDFVTKFVEPTGFKKWTDYVLGASDGIDKTPQWAEKITGVPAETTTAFARLYAASTPTYLFFGPGGARQYKGENPARLAVYLQVLTGNIGNLGGSVTFDGIVPFGTAFDSLPLPSPDYGTKPGSYQIPVLLINYRWADAVLLKEQLDAGKITKAQYQSAIGNPINNPVPNLKLLWLEDANRFNQWPNINKQIAAVKKMDYCVALQRHWNASARVADIVLPLAEHFEYNEGFINLNSGPMVYVPKFVEPQGEVKTAEWIYAQLAKNLGFLNLYMPNYSDSVDFDTQVVAAMKKGYETWAASAAVKSLLTTVPSWDDFVKTRVMRIDNSVPAKVPLTDQITKGAKFNTKSGLIEFYSDYLATTDLTQTKWGAPIAPMGIYESIPEGFYDPSIQSYPLVMLDTHNRHRTHTFQDSNPWLKGEIYRHAVWMSVADAKARGIKDNDIVLVRSQAGQMIIPAYVSQRIVPGTVYIYDGAFYDPTSSGTDKGGAPNVIADGGYNANGEDPHNTNVEVEKFVGAS